MTRLLTRLLLCLALAGAVPAAAQNLFAPVVQVNDDVITRFELQQRQGLLRVISPAQASADRARDDLINDALRNQALRQVGFTLGEDEVQTAMEDFAARGGLDLNSFIAALESNGIARETLRDFVSINVGWRDLIRARFGNRVAVTEQEIDRALASSTSTSSLRVLLSEIIIPAPPEQAAAVREVAERISQTRSTAEFSAAARQFSATASRDNGGRLDWTPIANLPPGLRPLLLSLAPGEVTQPIEIPNAVALFQLRDIQETRRPVPEYAAIEFARLLIADGGTDAARVAAQNVARDVDSCDDLYGAALGQPEEVLLRDTLAPADIPQDIALELAKLDENEVSTSLLTEDGARVVLMLCGRTAETNENVSRDAVAARLRSERLTNFSNSYLEELRADARIRSR